MTEQHFNTIRLTLMIVGFVALCYRKYQLANRVAVNTQGKPTRLGGYLVQEYRGIAFLLGSLALSFVLSILNDYRWFGVGFVVRQIGGMVPMVALVISWKRTDRFAREAIPQIERFDSAEG